MDGEDGGLATVEALTLGLNRVSKRGEAPLFNILPLSFEGEGDKGGEVENNLLH